MRILIFLLLLDASLVFAQADCVFNNDYKGLTSKWIEEANTEYQFIWIEKANTFVARINEKETIELTKGG